jgi:hypothetical protein
MPASLFAAWAGQHASVEYGVTAATGVTCRTKSSSAAALSAIALATDAAAQAPKPTAAPLLSQPVTVVAQGWTARLPPKPLLDQSSSQRNPGNLEIAACSAGLDAGDPVAWRTLFELRVAYRQKSGERTIADAEILAFGDCLAQWHHRHGARQQAERCAGCGEPFIDGTVLDLGQGARVHLDARLSCLTRYGQAWRSAAVAALHAFGLDTPMGFELL